MYTSISICMYLQTCAPLNPMYEKDKSKSVNELRINCKVVCNNNNNNTHTYNIINMIDNREDKEESDSQRDIRCSVQRDNTQSTPVHSETRVRSSLAILSYYQRPASSPTSSTKTCVPCFDLCEELNLSTRSLSSVHL